MRNNDALGYGLKAWQTIETKKIKPVLASLAFQASAMAVSKVTAIPPADIIQPSGWAAKRARRLVVYLMRTHFEIPRAEVAALLNMDKRAITKGVVVSEDARDIRSQDRLLQDIEDALTLLRQFAEGA